jgi:hypothetical protein
VTVPEAGAAIADHVSVTVPPPVLVLAIAGAASVVTLAAVGGDVRRGVERESERGHGGDDERDRERAQQVATVRAHECALPE